MEERGREDGKGERRRGGGDKNYCISTALFPSFLHHHCLQIQNVFLNLVNLCFDPCSFFVLETGLETRNVCLETESRAALWVVSFQDPHTAVADSFTSPLRGIRLRKMTDNNVLIMFNLCTMSCQCKE